MKSIKTKLIVYFGTIILVICAIFGMIAYKISRDAFIRDINDNLPKMSEQASKIVEGRIKNEIENLEVLANTDIIKDNKYTLNEKLEMLQSETTRRGHIRMGIADRNGKCIYNDGKELDISGREYFQNALKGQVGVSEPLISKIENSLVFVYSAPIKVNGVVVGVLLATRDGKEISNMVKDITYKKTGKAFIINSKGVTVAHQNEKLVLEMDNVIERAKKDSSLSELAEIEKKMINGESGIGEYNYSKIRNYVAYTPIKIANWSIALNAPNSEILAELNYLMKVLFIALLVLMGIGLTIVYIFGKAMAEPIIKAALHIDEIAKGNYTLESSKKYLKGKDEIGNLLRSVKEMQENVKNMLLIVKTNSENIQCQSNNLNMVSEQMAGTAENVAQAIQEVARGTGSQAEDLVKITSVLTNFSGELDNMLKAINEIDENTKAIGVRADESNAEMKNVTASVSKVVEVFDDLTDKVSNVEKNINKINDITNLINSISEKTNLLALNAAIEAARAGEAGRGFSVVADEIRQLAEQSKDSALDINKLIVNISNDSETMVKATEIVKCELDDQKIQIETAIVSFGDIIKSVEDVKLKIDLLSSGASEINKQKESILVKIEGSSAVAEEVSAAAQQISASSQEMNACSEEVSASSEELHGTTLEMVESISKFKL